MAVEIDQLRAEVERNTQVDQSAIALINGIADRLRAVEDQLSQQGADTAALTELRESLENSSNDLATAVAAHTQAEPGGMTGAGQETGGVEPGEPFPSEIGEPTGDLVPGQTTGEEPTVSRRR